MFLPRLPERPDNIITITTERHLIDLLTLVDSRKYVDLNLFSLKPLPTVSLSDFVILFQLLEEGFSWYVRVCVCVFIVTNVCNRDFDSNSSIDFWVHTDCRPFRYVKISNERESTR